MEKSSHIENPLGCPMVMTINIIGGKWKPVILHMLSSRSMRFGQLKNCIPPVSQKMLTQQLRELELDGIVSRTVYPEVPPRVDYALTALGESLIPVIETLYQWGENYLKSGAGKHAEVV
ncbi:MAG: transcriptional regulator [Paucimonas sp.]|jgi:DNA-binding HxlR family transcriptional regulator|nr:transcriptional regulator [Paucimonas sp.]